LITLLKRLLFDWNGPSVKVTDSVSAAFKESNGGGWL